LNNRGQKGEELAERYLINNGYQILAKNWRGIKELKSPEIDLIAKRNDLIIFVEVKSFKTGLFGNPEYWITPAKQRRLSKGAKVYLALFPEGNINYRFDAIIVDRRKKSDIINHIENAFSLAEENIDI
jgi:putative endonuclease